MKYFPYFSTIRGISTRDLGWTHQIQTCEPVIGIHSCWTGLRTLAFRGSWTTEWTLSAQHRLIGQVVSYWTPAALISSRVIYGSSWLHNLPPPPYPLVPVEHPYYPKSVMPSSFEVSDLKFMSIANIHKLSSARTLEGMHILASRG